jgi:hypothetical protein
VTRSRFALLLALACLSAVPLCALEFSLKVYGGWRLASGGDLNSSIIGWRDYYADRSSASFSSLFDWQELNAALEAGAELEVGISPRLSFGLSVGIMPGVTSGTISTKSATAQTTAVSASVSKTVTVEETTSRMPRTELTAVPVLLTAYYRFALGERLMLVAGAGGGAYFARYSYSEPYEYNFSSVEDLVSAGLTSRYIDRSAVSGEYFEEAQDARWGVHALVGLEYRLGGNLAAVFDVSGRWVSQGPWGGSKTDDYEWSRTWGPWGGYSDFGEVTESSEGELWIVETVSDTTGKTYPRLVFSEEQPAGSGYAFARRADLGLGGIAVRLGLKIGFGGRH